MSIEDTKRRFNQLMSEGMRISTAVRQMLVEEYDALEICIAKYQWIFDNKKVEDCGIPECALCLQHNMGSLNNCLGCIIYKHTGKDSCRGTPYDDITYDLDEMPYAEEDEEFIKQYLLDVKDELEFLIELWTERDGENNAEPNE